MSNGMTMRIVAIVGIAAACAAVIVAKQRETSKHSMLSARDTSHAVQTDVRQSHPEVIELTRVDGTSKSVRLCQATHGMMLGVHCDDCGTECREARWHATRPIPWEVFAQGDYVGPARMQHVPEYLLRVNDEIETHPRPQSTPSWDPRDLYPRQKPARTRRAESSPPESPILSGLARRP